MNARSGTYAILAVNPVWWVVSAFYLFLTSTALVNYKNFPFGSLNFFTLVWIGTALTAAHCLLNLKTFREYFSLRLWRDIPRFLCADMSHYLPYLLMAGLYDNIPLFHDTARLRFNNLDYSLLRADEMIFGVQPTIFLQDYLNPYLVEYSMIMYSFFVLPYLFLVYLFQKRESTLFSKLLLAHVIASIVALTCFIYLPAKGPRFVFDTAGSRLYENLPQFKNGINGVRIDSLYRATGYESLYRLQYDAWNNLERVKTDCMPSMHAALYLICIIIAVRYRKIMKWKRLATGFWITSGVSMLFSCIYLRYHWVIDIIAGIVVAFFSYSAAELIIERWLHTRELASARNKQLVSASG